MDMERLFFSFKLLEEKYNSCLELKKWRGWPTSTYKNYKQLDNTLLCIRKQLFCWLSWKVLPLGPLTFVYRPFRNRPYVGSDGVEGVSPRQQLIPLLCWSRYKNFKMVQRVTSLGGILGIQLVNLISVFSLFQTSQPRMWQELCTQTGALRCFTKLCSIRPLPRLKEHATEIYVPQDGKEGFSNTILWSTGLHSSHDCNRWRNCGYGCWYEMLYSVNKLLTKCKESVWNKALPFHRVHSVYVVKRHV